MAAVALAALLAVALLACSASAQQTPISERLLTSASIIPDVVDGVSLDGKLEFSIQYTSGRVDAGNFLSTNATASAPTVKVSCKPGACSVPRRTLYTLIMADPDAPSPANHTLRSYWHWGVINMPNGRVAAGDAITQYVGPAPPTGVHRYVLLLFRQQGPISAPQTPSNGRAKFDVNKFASTHNLGKPVAVKWFTSKPKGGR